jgi:microcin C transport system substrate-binding protein
MVLRTLIVAMFCPLFSHAHANESPFANSLTLFGSAKYAASFEQNTAHFDYVNPKAPEGGTFRMSAIGTFDSLNPFILKGVAAPAVNTLVFQSLMTPSLDEPQSYYPLIASGVHVAPDSRWVEFTLNPKARFHDGSKVTAEDVVFSAEMFKTKAHPAYRVLYREIARVIAINSHQVRFEFTEKEHRELPLYAAAMPILSKAYYSEHDFEKTSLDAPLGSGPYRVEKIDAGRAIRFYKVKNYWAKHLPSQRGMYHFERVHIDMYRDDVVALEGLKSHQFDYYEEYIARNWATSYNIPAVKEGRLIKIGIENKIPRGMQGFIFNTRREQFSDARVREAIALTMDFEWMNQRLFYNAYSRTNSFFQNTEFAASGIPGGAEKALLSPWRNQLPEQLFSNAFTVPKSDGSGYDREHLIRAQQLLNDAGWIMKDGVRVNAKTGEPLTLEFLMSQRTFERVIAIMKYNLGKLGITASFRYVDSAQYQKRVDNRDFDIVSIWWNLGTHFPGSEQYAFWHSREADTAGSQNLGGIKDPVVDALVEKIAAAKTLEQLRPAARALDRVLLWRHYVVPHWYISNWRVLYWNQFERPKIQPAYAVGAIETWWMNPQTER